MGKDPFENLNLDGQDMKPLEDKFFEDDQELPAPPNVSAKEAQPSLPAHIKRSHPREEELWRMNILPSATDQLSLKIGSKRKAQQMRNRLYNARTYLKYSDKIRVDDPTYKNPLDDWTLLIEERKGIWYIIALNLHLDEGFVEE